jgi:hypothetical protein
MVQRDEGGAAKADMFFVAYILDRPDDAPPTTRPITFIFNGGPGAASVWLHLGTAGPKRINLNDSAINSAPPFELADNEATWLDASDLVFIDPVGTGYSRPAQGEKGEQFYGVEAVLNQYPQFNPGATQFSASNVTPNSAATPGVSTLNMRGLGDGRGLVLIDGRRAWPTVGMSMRLSGLLNSVFLAQSASWT